MSSAARADEDYGDEKDDEEEVPLQFKIVILGDGAVGKTSLVARFIEDTFSQSYKQTLGVDFHSNKVILPDGQDVTLQLWDIGGQSIGSKMLPHYISGSHAVLLAYDITNKESFANLEEWYRVVAKTFKGQNPVVTGLVANKSDMMHSCEVSTVEHNRLAAMRSLACDTRRNLGDRHFTCVKPNYRDRALCRGRGRNRIGRLARTSGKRRRVQRRVRRRAVRRAARRSRCQSTS